MYHSITFGEKNTWDDWHLIPTSRPVFNPPSPKTVYCDVPGGNGAIDLTDSLLDGPVYNNREGSFEFIVANDYWPSWIDCYTEIMAYLHGKRMEAFLEDEPNYSYNGRFSVSEWNSNNDGTWSNINIDYIVDPFKYSQMITKPHTISGTQSISITDLGDMPVVPILHATSEMTIRQGTVNYQLPANTDKTMHEIRLTKANRYFIASGSGTLTVKYRNGVL